MKNRYHFICWVCCMLVGITVTRSQEFRRIPSTVAIESSLQLTDLSGEVTASADDNSDHIFHFSENTIAGSASWAIGSNLIISNQTICANATPAGLTGSLPTGGNGSFAYQWQISTASGTTGFSDIGSATNQHYAPPALTATTWYRRVVLSGAESDTSASIQITVKPTSINLLITNPAPVCSPNTVDITAAAITAGSTADLTYTYHPNVGGITVLSNPNAISSTLALNKDFFIKATNGCGSWSIKPVRVVINPQPTVSVISPTIPVCKYGAAPLTAFSFGNNITWQNLAPTVLNASSVIAYPSEQTTYNVIVTVPATGCSRTVPATVQVRDFSMSLAASPDPVIAGNPVTLTPSSVTNFTVNGWLPENLFASQTAPTQSFTISDTSRTFSVIGRSEDGCLDTASVKVSIDVNTTDIFVPNAFTPNNDGRNDIFKVYGSSVKNIEMKIFDQWGRSVHETNNNTTGWDGSHQGKPQPVGVYMYVIKISLDNEDSFIRKGTVNLIR